jgi:hypothetical protein
MTGIRNRMDMAYVDKLDGKIPEDFWERKMSEWRMEEQQVKMAIQGLGNAETGNRALDAQRISNSRIRPIHCTFRRIRSKRPNAQNAIFELLR